MNERKKKKIMVSLYSKSSNETAIDHAHNTWTLMSNNKQLENIQNQPDK